MFLRNLLVLFALTFSINVIAQHRIHVKHSCGYTTDVTEYAEIMEFSSNAEAEAVMNDIMTNVGLRPNFEVRAADVPNAAAVVSENKRFILYNPNFIQSVESGTKTNWSAISILAHEIGHHLNGHTLTNLGSRPKMEIEADEFSGFILRKMGATLTESQAAMNFLASPKGSSTHPPKAARLSAIAEGWNRANEMMPDFEVPTNEPAKPNPPVVENDNKPTCPDGHNRTETTTAEHRPNGNTPVTRPKPEEKIEHPSFARWQVIMTNNPNSTYYITTGNQFVVFRNGRVYEIGKFHKTNNERYPFVIKMENSPDLLISRSGELVSIKGQSVGSVKKV